MVEAVVIFPDHLHTIRTLPPDDDDFASRWMLVKAGFSRHLPKGERISASLAKKGERGIWQRRYWEHLLRNDDDFARHIDYIHYKPVKHGYTTKPVDWPYSSIHRFIRKEIIAKDWGGEMQFN